MIKKRLTRDPVTIRVRILIAKTTSAACIYRSIINYGLSAAVPGDLPYQKLPDNLRHGHPVVDCLYFQRLMNGFRNINRQPLGFPICCAGTANCHVFEFFHLNNPVLDNSYWVILDDQDASLVPTIGM